METMQLLLRPTKGVDNAIFYNGLQHHGEGLMRLDLRSSGDFKGIAAGKADADHVAVIADVG